ncbi:hypothetical protein BBJ28_00013781 [Nothophytophthora sp. Chile5]|nr:hypothetical protein BBJ28_00013781 [Nothophytophthora sp. Chile5]
MHDPVQGKTLPHILNDLLTERAFGRTERTADAESAWIWSGRKALGGSSRTDPVADGEVSYGAFLRAKVCFHMRKVLRQDFTAPGNPGEGLAAEHHELLRHLLLPQTAASSEGAMQMAGLADSPYCFVVPAFFKLLQYLQTNAVRFNLIFRTFGDDLHRVAQEFNCFCEGRHPCFPLDTPMDGSDGGIDRRIHLQTPPDGVEPPRFGTFVRAGDLTMLVMGTFKQPKIADDKAFDYYAAQSENLHIVRELPNIHAFLTGRWRDSQATLALRDFYPFWFQNREAATAGKLLTLDSMFGADEVHAMFFDDNILAHDAHIVDARVAHDGSAVEFEHTRELHLMRVEPLEAIQSDMYFVNRFEASLQRWRRQKQQQDAN